MKYYNKLNKIIASYEKEHLFINDILDKCLELIEDYEHDKEFIYELNDVLFNRGYPFKFNVDEEKKEVFDQDKYVALSTNVSKSKEKTKAFIDYLASLNSSIISLASLHMLKIKHLIALDIVYQWRFLDDKLNEDIRTVYFEHYHDEVTAKYFESVMEEYLGVKFASSEYMKFRLDLEYLLWTIERDDINYGYKKVNTIKIALNIAPKELFIRNGKKYYNENFSSSTSSYLKLIDKKEKAWIKAKYGENGNEADGTGYLALYHLL